MPVKQRPFNCSETEEECEYCDCTGLYIDCKERQDKHIRESGLVVSSTVSFTIMMMAFAIVWLTVEAIVGYDSLNQGLTTSVIVNTVILFAYVGYQIQQHIYRKFIR